MASTAAGAADRRDSWKTCARSALPESADMLKDIWHAAASVQEKTDLLEMRVDEYGSTALRLACARGMLTTVQWMVEEAKADVNPSKPGEVSLLYHACFNGQREVAQYLVQAGANMNVKSGSGWTALHAASYGGHTATVAFLAAAGANRAAKTTKLVTMGSTKLPIGCTAQEIAHIKGHSEIVAILNVGTRALATAAAASPPPVPAPSTPNSVLQEQLRKMQEDYDRRLQLAAQAHQELKQQAQVQIAALKAERDTWKSTCEMERVQFEAERELHQRRITGLSQDKTILQQQIAELKERIAQAAPQLLKRIGRGGFGQVFMGVHTSQIKHEVAVKVIPIDSDETKVSALQEIVLLDSLRHPAIVGVQSAELRVHGDHASAGAGIHDLQLVMEYCKGGSLESLEGLLMPPVFEELMRQALSGLAFMHDQTPPVQHFDIKPSNICLARELTANVWDVAVKWIDFGAAAETDVSVLSRRTGTEFFWSPERCDAPPRFNLKDDVWACGITFLLAGCARSNRAAIIQECAVCRHSGMPQYEDRIQQLLTVLQATYGSKLTKVLRMMLHRDAERRCSAADAFSMLQVPLENDK